VKTRRAIDMGCADGVLIPTLSNFFEKVVAVEVNPIQADQSERLVRLCNIDNVEVICNQGISMHEISQRIGNGYKILWLLETLEHIGEQPDIWAPKLEFLHSCFELLDDDGQIVISVPKMVGFGFLGKYLLQNYCLDIKHDQMTFANLFRSVLFKNTDNLEPLWAGGHVGFNHLKLDDLLNEHFEVLRRKETIISCLYLIRRKRISSLGIR